MNGERTHRISWALFVVMAAWLVVQAAFRTVVPAHGLPASSTTYVEIWLDVLSVVILLVCRMVLSGLGRDDPRMAWRGLVLWCGLIGAAVIFAIRFLGDDHSFWSGHLMYRFRL